jgi:hypothetical protein
MTTTALACRRTIDDVEHDIVAAAARMNSAMYAFLLLVREYDERAGFLAWGHKSCAEWLHWRCDLGTNAARERVRVAHALALLPQMSEGLARGMLSYSKARALTRVATPDNEAALLAFARTATTARVEERVCQMRNARRASTAEAASRHAQRSLRVFRDLGRGTMTITVEVPFEQGELLCRAVDKAVRSAPDPGPELRDTPWLARQADALVDIAKDYLAGGSDASGSSAEHYQVVVHVDAPALEGGEGRSDLPIETVRRLTCDGSTVEVTDGRGRRAAQHRAQAAHGAHGDQTRALVTRPRLHLPRLHAHPLRRRPSRASLVAGRPHEPRQPDPALLGARGRVRGREGLSGQMALPPSGRPRGSRAWVQAGRCHGRDRKYLTWGIGSVRVPRRGSHAPVGAPYRARPRGVSKKRDSAASPMAFSIAAYGRSDA